MSSPRSSSSNLVASTLFLLGFSASALLTSYLASVIRRRRHERRDSKRSLVKAPTDSTFPPTNVDQQTLAKIELGSDAMRREFFLDFDSITFLNHGSYGSVPRRVMKYFETILQRVEVYPDIWFRLHSWEMTRQAIKSFAAFLNCDEDGLVYVNNATAAVNAVLSSSKFQSGDILLTADSTYNAVKLAMRHEAERQGAEYVEFPLPLPIKNDQAVIDAYTAVLNRLGSKVKFLLIDAITSPTAIVLPYEQLARLARSRGIPCMIDAAHAIGALPVDLGKFDYDYFTTNLHKWMFAVKGCALLYSNATCRSTLHPPVTSHYTKDSYAKRFWMQATREDGAYIASVEALRFVESIGLERSRTYTRNLLDAATELLTPVLSNPSSTSSSNKSAPVSLMVCPLEMQCPTMRLLKLPWGVPATPSKRGALSEPLMLHFMKHYKVVVPIIYEEHTNAYYIRLSAQIYNRIQDYERLAEALADYVNHPIEGHENAKLR